MPRAPANLTTPRYRLVDHLPAVAAMLEHQRQFRLEQLVELAAVVEDTAPTTAADRTRHEVAVKLARAARHALADIDRALALVATGGYAAAAIARPTSRFACCGPSRVANTPALSAGRIAVQPTIR